MKERPILFSAPMVRAILDGRKTQTRRVVKFIPELGDPKYWCKMAVSEPAKLSFLAGDYTRYCPYGQPFERLWVKETFSAHGAFGVSGRVCYRADIPDGREPHGAHWRPSIFMPRLASRITLEITAVRVERLQAISRGDAMAEGCPFPNMAKGDNPRHWYADLWAAINGPDSWAANPYVWVIEFKRKASQ